MQDPLEIHVDTQGMDGKAVRALSAELQHVRTALTVAQDAQAMPQLSRRIRALAHDALACMPAHALTRMISALNDALTYRIIELACTEMRVESDGWCWIALGSEGRQEQTFSSDQDNGIIFPNDGNADTQRERLLPLAALVNQWLDECGFPLCRGNIMASNPDCCLSQHEWHSRFSEWMIEGDTQSLLNATIFFDFRPLYGNVAQANLLGDWLTANAADNPRFLFQMSANSLRRDAPLGFLHGFALEKHGEYAGTIDLKLQAATLFVDAARVFALASQAHVANTADRLRQAAKAGLLEDDEVTAWIDAFYLIEKLRLVSQHASHVRGEPMHNHINPDLLDAEDRDALLDALHQARALQKRLAMAYQGSA